MIAENKNVLRLINHSEFKVGNIADCVTGFYSGDEKRFLQVISVDFKNGKNYNLVNPETTNTDYKSNPEILNGIERNNILFRL